MNTNLGFGKPQSKPSQRSTKRAEAARQYDQMKANGTPDFEIYVRIQGKKNWYPVGAIVVKRSNQINQAIFANQKELLQGAFRLYPVLRKHQHQLEYGYRLKEFKDDPIQLAAPPIVNSNTGIQTVVARFKDQITSLFKQA